MTSGGSSFTVGIAINSVVPKDGGASASGFENLEGGICTGSYPANWANNDEGMACGIVAEADLFQV